MKNRKNITIQISKLTMPLFLVFGGLTLSFFASSNNLVLAQNPSQQQVDENKSTCPDINNNDECQGIQMINRVLNFMALIVVPLCGILVSVAGVQYMISRNNPEMASEARMRIYKVILALVIFASLWTFLKWLLPGGILE